MDYVAESKQDFAESLRFCRSFEVLSPLPLNERPKALSTDVKVSHTKPLCKDAKPTEQATLNTHFQKLYRFFYKLLPPLF